MGEQVRFLLCGMLAVLLCCVLVLSLTATLSSSFLAISTFPRGVDGQRNAVSLSLDSV